MMRDRRRQLGLSLQMRRGCFWGCFLGLLLGNLLLGNVAWAPAQTRQQLEQARKQLVEEAIIGGGVKDKRVIQSILDTPRHEFVPLKERPRAYYDMALPIGERQTISSPFIVAFMTEALEPQPTDRVLEIGTGSGYQAAVLSPLVNEVYTIEIVEELGRRAARVLERLRYRNVHTRIGDGFLGWPEAAPFDKIIVTCSPERVPQPLVDQLRDGGLMAIPVGERYQQTLYLFRKRNGKLESEALRPTLFVPMTGEAEDRRRTKPDPKNPQLHNGGFEEEPEANEFLPGWYYQRQASRQRDVSSPEGGHYVQFENSEPGRVAHAIQGLGMDGRAIRELAISAWIKTHNVRDVVGGQEFATIAVTFFDDNRKDLGTRVLGRFRGTDDWHRVSGSLRVPIQTREAIFRIGLFGATGTIGFDGIEMKPVAR